MWHRLGAKTVELIHENVRGDAVRDDLETLVFDADLLEAVLDTPDPGSKSTGDYASTSTTRASKSSGNDWRR